MSYLMEKPCSFFVAQSKVVGICCWFFTFLHSIATILVGGL
jgi:hypothetical protein